MNDELRIKKSIEVERIIRGSAGEGDSININNKGIRGSVSPSSPPTPPSPPKPKVCLYEDPATREAIRRKLKELEITNINQLIRSYQAAELIEAISDYERALEDGFYPRHPTGYFKSLLK